MKSFLPWLVALALLGAAAFFFSSNRKLNVEVATLRTERAQMDSLRAEVEQLKQTGSPVQAEEIARLRKNTEELLKLRGENQRLRGETKELTQKAQAAQTQAQSAQAREQAAKEQAQAYASHANAALAQAQAAQQVARAGGQGLTPVQMLNACINNLRQMDGAKQQWALENRKTAKETPPAEQLAVYLKEGMPKCPGGGTYTLGAVESNPTCTIAGHALPLQ